MVRVWINLSKPNLIAEIEPLAFGLGRLHRTTNGQVNQDFLTMPQKDVVSLSCHLALENTEWSPPSIGHLFMAYAWEAVHQ